MRYTKKQIEDMDKTERPWKSTVSHKWLRFLCNNKKARILDFGCGKRATMPQVLRDQGYKNAFGYDIMFEEHKTEDQDRFNGTLEKSAFNALGTATMWGSEWQDHKTFFWHYIVVSNVINIQPTKEHIYSTLKTINSLIKPKTTAIINYPTNPRTLPEISNGMFRDMIDDVFNANPKHKVLCTFGSHGVIALIKGGGK
tara:strand:- start:122 stop:715 length:594 start_codon:yes stop_codon:yes gene_type:complete